jgi:nitrate reductase NapE component
VSGISGEDHIVMSSIMRWRNGLIVLITLVMGLFPVVWVASFGDYNLNTGKAHAVNT